MNAHILVDQFGYRPADPKVAVVRNPMAGYDMADTFKAGSTYQLRQSSDGSVVFSASPTPWNNGATEDSSGDNGWFFDFSSVTSPGNYFVYDVTNQARSPTFAINQNVYKNVLVAAMRYYFYQRSGSSGGGGAKQAPFADQCWADSPAYIGPNQDTMARDSADQGNASTAHDLSGGWFDAGDTNKYVTNASAAVHQLLSAYQETPAVFTDDFNIPESGNGVPDVIDEVKYETDFLKKMQFSADGSVALKLGVLGFPGGAPPSSDKSARYYVGSCTSSTIAMAGTFAHASYVYAQIPSLAAEAADLKTRAVNAWNNYQSIPTKQAACDTGVVKAGPADWPVQLQQQESVVAAVWLYAITGDQTYNTYVMNNYTMTEPFTDIGFTRYLPEQGKALLFYTTLPNADATLKSAVLQRKQSDVATSTNIYGFNPNDDLYRNYLDDDAYVDGSNQVRANYGNTNADVLSFPQAISNTAPYSMRALETLHYIHGVNPFGMVYLSNMASYGATSSANEIFTLWYVPGTMWADALTSPCGPAPGYMPAGPTNVAAGTITVALTPPDNQPLQKSYRDFNGVVGDPQNSYIVSEPGIYYQAAYVELLSRFAK